MQCPVCTFPKEASNTCHNCGWEFIDSNAETKEQRSQRLRKHLTDWNAEDVPLPCDFEDEHLPDYEFISVEAQQFLMGSPENEMGRDDDEQLHEVLLTKAFLIGRTEVHQNLYRAVTGENPSSFPSSNKPVESITWLEACLFCNQYSLKMGLTPVYDIQLGKPMTVIWNKSNYGYRLPTEAEWECAAKQARQEESSFRGWYDRTSQLETHPVGQQSGLSDIAGNVWEMCWDYYGVYPTTNSIDPTGPTVGEYRVTRGGSWIDTERIIRPSNRGFIREDSRGNSVGFRLVLDQPPKSSL